MFGNIKRFQDDNYGGRNIACGLDSPDFVKLAQSFGALGLRAETPQELRKQLRLAFESEGPTLIEVPTGEMPSLGISFSCQKTVAFRARLTGLPWQYAR